MICQLYIYVILCNFQFAFTKVLKKLQLTELLLSDRCIFRQNLLELSVKRQIYAFFSIKMRTFPSTTTNDILYVFTQFSPTTDFG